MKGITREGRALDLIREGASALAKGRQEAVALFAKAEELSEESPLVLYWIGLAWLSYGREGREQGWLKAREFFERATLQDGTLSCAWKGLGCALGQLGAAYGELELFQKGDEAFRRGCVDDPDLHSEWGKMLTLCGALSEEGIDYRHALERFEQAERLGAKGADFWIEKGRVYRALSDLTCDRTHLLRAISAFEQGADLPEGRLEMARTLAYLYALEGGRLSFDRAQVAFVAAAMADPTSAKVKIEWARHLIAGAGGVKEERFLKEAMEKIAAAEMAGGDPVLCAYLKVKGLIGRGEELGPLYEAQGVGEECVGRMPTEPLAYCALAESLEALGDYFAEAPYVEEALSHFQHALTLDGGCLEAHLGMARLMALLAGGEEERPMLEQAIGHAAAASRSPLHAATAHHLWGVALAKLAEIRSRSLLAREAVDHFEQAIALKGGPGGVDDHEWLFHYGCALDLLGTFHDDEGIHYRAIQVLEAVLANNAEDPSIRFQLAMAYVHYGELACDPEAFDKALLHFAEVAAIRPDEEAVWDEWGCSLLSYAHLVDDPAHLEEADRLRRDAREKLLVALKLGGHEALYHLAWLYAEVGEHQTATTFLERAAEKGVLPSRDQLLEEEWLEALRHTEAFRDFLDRI